MLPDMRVRANFDRGFRYPAGVIQHAVWRYHGFSPSLRDIALILSIHSRADNHFPLRRHRLNAAEHRTGLLSKRDEQGARETTV